MKTVRYRLYQLPASNPNCFRPLQNRDVRDLSDYKLAYEGTVDDHDTATDPALCEHLFMLHNRDDRPNPLAGRSLSMSDIVVLHEGDEARCYYCDTYGFKLLPNCKA